MATRATMPIFCFALIYEKVFSLPTCDYVMAGFVVQKEDCSRSVAPKQLRSSALCVLDWLISPRRFSFPFSRLNRFILSLSLPEYKTAGLVIQPENRLALRAEYSLSPGFSNNTHG